MRFNRKIIFFGFLLNIFLQETQGQVLYNGYTDKLSYREGETVTFFLSGVDPFNIDYRIMASDGSQALTISGFTNANVLPQSPNQPYPWYGNGLGYDYSPCSNTWTVPSLSTLKSGRYMFRGNSNLTEIPIIIKDSDYPSTSDIIVVIPTNTVNAYTQSFGHSLYDPTGGAATTVSFLRPLVLDNYGRYDDGFLSWITTWANTMPNYKVGFISDIDMDDYDEFRNAKVLIIIGHSEYWTRQARLNFDKFVDEGKDALILSGNTMWWQVRYSIDDFVENQTLMTCKRGANWNFSDDPISDPLLKTYHWGEPSLKYSILGSIGSDYMRAGNGVEGGGDNCYPGFNGHKIVLPQSPLLNGLGFSFHNILKFATGEFDGTLVKTDADGNAILNGDGDPELDVAALGFYRAELIGYDKTTQPYPDPNPANLNDSYIPFMVFQKTCTSGTIINVNSNEWCTDWVIGLLGPNPHGNPHCTQPSVNPDTRIPQITENMINLMMQDQISNVIGINNGDNLFYNPRPSPSMTIKPTYTNVSYNACSTGSIDITPCGVYLTDGYKVDRGFSWNYGSPWDSNNNSFTATIDLTCTNYNNGLRETQNPIDKPEIKTEINIFPNPNSGIFNLKIQNFNPISTIEIYNTIGEKIYSNTISKLQTANYIDLSSQPNGIYFLQLKSENGIASQKIIIQK